MRVFSTSSYRPVWKCVPSSTEWKRLECDMSYETTYTVYYKLSWSFEVPANDNEIFFAYAPPYSYEETQETVRIFEKGCPEDCKVWREVIAKSLDGRNAELITFSHKNNFSEITEATIPDLFVEKKDRCLVSKKPIIFITSRVHPGETPGSFVLDSLLQILLSNDPRAVAIRNAFVFKIIPVLNPDGVYRGNFRVDQNGINLNRCYAYPDQNHHPTIYAVCKYFEYLAGKVKYYFDLHAHASKRSCFLFGNSLEVDKQIENQLLAKLIELNTGYFEFSECDFSIRSMTSKDPKDHNSKEGSGRVAFYKKFGIIHSYTLECAYYIPRPLHIIPSPMNLKSGKRFSDLIQNDFFSVQVHNRSFFNEIASSLIYSILDYEKINPISRIPLSEFRFIEAAKEWVKAKILSQTRNINKRNITRTEIKSVKRYDKGTGYPKINTRRIHKPNIIAPMFQEGIQMLSRGKISIFMGKLASSRPTSFYA